MWYIIRTFSVNSNSIHMFHNHILLSVGKRLRVIASGSKILVVRLYPGAPKDAWDILQGVCLLDAAAVCTHTDTVPTLNKEITHSESLHTFRYHHKQFGMEFSATCTHMHQPCK